MLFLPVLLGLVGPNIILICGVFIPTQSEMKTRDEENVAAFAIRREDNTHSVAFYASIASTTGSTEKISFSFQDFFVFCSIMPILHSIRHSNKPNLFGIAWFTYG